MNREKIIINRVKTAESVGAFTDRWYEKLWDKKLSVWTLGATPLFQMFEANDIGVLDLGNYSARVSSRCQGQPHINVAEESGFLPETCSYGRICLGNAMLLESEQIERVRNDCRIPKPNLIVAITACPVLMYTADALRRIHKVPMFVVDIPYLTSPDDKLAVERNVAHIQRQIGDLVKLLEEMMGHPFNWERLRDMHVWIKKSTELRVGIINSCAKAFPCPMSFFDWLVFLALANVQRGTPKAFELLEKLRDEVQDRIGKGIGSIPNERYRLFWDHIAIWYGLGRVSRLFAQHGAVVVGGMYPWDQYGHPELVDPDRPLWTMANEFIHFRTDIRPVEFEMRRIENWIKEYSVDGVVFHEPRTCRDNAIRIYDKAEVIEEALGIPTLVIEADHTDPKFYREDQVEVKVQAFLESIEARRGLKV